MTPIDTMALDDFCYHEAPLFMADIVAHSQPFHYNDMVHLLQYVQYVQPTESG